MTTCAKCNGRLVLEVDDEDSSMDMETGGSSSTNNQTVPDDVHLPCGDHFHWECLVDSYEYSKCPHCSQDILTQGPDGHERIVVTLNNEGGLQEELDIAPILREESYLRTYPEENRCRAFLEFCREGDHRAVVEVLRNENGDDDDEDDDQMQSAPPKSIAEILRYQDPINDMQSGLHAAVANGHREVAWLLLLLASQVPELEFPALVYQEAAALGIMREDQEGLPDIRSLRDAHGRSAEDIARESGLIWNGWIGNGRLAMP